MKRRKGMYRSREVPWLIQISFLNLDNKEKKERTVVLTTRRRKNSECLLGLMEISTSVQAIV